MEDFDHGGGTVSDRIAIQELVHRYCDALCQRNHGALVDTFTSDGIWDIGQGEVVGRDALSEKFRKVFELFEHVVQLTHNGEVKLDTDTAQGPIPWACGGLRISRAAAIDDGGKTA